jgi:hypothetical protein
MEGYKPSSTNNSTIPIVAPATQSRLLPAQPDLPYLWPPLHHLSTRWPRYVFPSALAHVLEKVLLLLPCHEWTSSVATPPPQIEVLPTPFASCVRRWAGEGTGRGSTCKWVYRENGKRPHRSDEFIEELLDLLLRKFIRCRVAATNWVFQWTSPPFGDWCIFFRRHNWACFSLNRGWWMHMHRPHIVLRMIVIFCRQNKHDIARNCACSLSLFWVCPKGTNVGEYGSARKCIQPNNVDATNKQLLS